jgi:hypothetical protein
MRKSGAHDLVEGNGEVAARFAGGVIDGVGDGCGCSCDADFADVSGPERIEFVVGDVERGDVDFLDVGVDGAWYSAKVSPDEPICVDEVAEEKDAYKKWNFIEDLEGIMWAFTQASAEFYKAFSGRVNWVSLHLSNLY